MWFFKNKVAFEGWSISPNVMVKYERGWMVVVQMLMLKCRCSSKRNKIDCLCFQVQGQIGEKYAAWML